MTHKIIAILFALIALIALPTATLAAPAAQPPAPTPGSLVDLVTIEGPNDSGLSADWRLTELEDGSLQVSPDMTLQMIFQVAEDGTVTADGVGGSAIDTVYGMLGYTSTFGDYTKFPKYWDDALDNSGVQFLQIAVRGDKITITVDNVVIVPDARLSGLAYVWNRVERAGFAWAGTADMFAAAMALSSELGLNSVNFAILTAEFDGSPLSWPETYGAQQAAASAPAARQTVEFLPYTIQPGDYPGRIAERMADNFGVDEGCALDVADAWWTANPSKHHPGFKIQIPGRCIPVTLGGSYDPAEAPFDLSGQ